MIKSTPWKSLIVVHKYTYIKEINALTVTETTIYNWHLVALHVLKTQEDILVCSAHNEQNFVLFQDCQLQ